MTKKTKRARGRPLGSGRLVWGFPEPREFSGQEVKRLRVTLAKRAGFKKKLSVADLADVLGVNRVAVYLWEHDRKAPSSAARRLLEILWLVPEAAPGLIAKDGAWRKCLERKTRKRRVGK